MRLASVRYGGICSWGVIENQTFLDVGQVLKARYVDLKSAIAAALLGVEEAKANASKISLEEVEWLPVIPNPDKIFCVGINYEMHREETGRTKVDYPTIFTRYASSQIGHLAPILRPKISTELDYEGELAVIIGKSGRHISFDDAMHHVFGYACYNDVSVRDFQRHTSQYTPGKNFPGTGAFGPWVVTADEVADIQELSLRTRLNSKLVQDAKISEMIFDIPKQIEYCSSFTKLEAGDVIITGTPGGVGARREPPLWMKSGDVVEVEIDKIGILKNIVRNEA